MLSNSCQHVVIKIFNFFHVFFSISNNQNQVEFIHYQTTKNRTQKNLISLGNLWNYLKNKGLGGSKNQRSPGISVILLCYLIHTSRKFYKLLETKYPQSLHVFSASKTDIEKISRIPNILNRFKAANSKAIF